MTSELEDFENVQVLSKKSDRNIFRVKNLADHITYILKSIGNDYPTPRDLAKINHEFLILKKIENSGVIKVIDLKRMKNNLGLLMEDISFYTLADYLSKRTINIDEFLDIAIKISETLGKIHAQEIIHRNIKPDNILYNQSTKEVKLVDFELASELSHDYQPSKVINSLEGTLAYISPEQTGRMNRPVTASADLYSLGVTFYQMLTRRLPFEETDPVSLVYAHIAKIPKTPHAINSEIPEIISDIIMKLLCKKSEDRYKTAFGLKTDFQICQEQYKENNKIIPFRLGTKDYSDKFKIPDKLYGREKEIEDVLSVFESMCKEDISKLLLVSGYSGIGKTALINEVHRPIVQKNGIFIGGKIDQYHRDQPYFALTQAFNKLVEMLLGEKDETLRAWREKLTRELGDVSQVIIDLVPLLGKLIKNPPKLTELNPLETKNRLHLTLLKFIKILTADKTPLVLFIDDAQWGTSTLIDLLKYLITTGELQYLMIVIGYRDNEVLAGHPLLQFIDEVEHVKPIAKIKLKPLNIISVNEMVRDTLGYSAEEAKQLTEIVYNKTEGNPFFLKEILQDLYTKKLLHFSRLKNTWEFDPQTISKQVNITSNVVDFMILRLKGLTLEMQKVMNIAACIGNTFSLDDLTEVLKQGKNEISQALWLIVKEGMILPVSGDYEHAHEKDDRKDKLDSNIVYRFQHDRIQQAAYQLTTREENNKTHLQIGKALLSKYANQTEKFAVEIASQFNKAIELITSQKDRTELMHLNYQAGETMLASSAYLAAVEYFSVADSLLPEDHWTSLYAFIRQFYISYVKALFSSTLFEKAEELMENLINHANTLMERMSIINLKVTLYSTTGKRNVSIPLNIQALNELGVVISEKPTSLAITLEELKIKWYLGTRKVPSLINEPEVNDPKIILVSAFLYLLTQDSMFSGNAPLLQLSILKSVSLSLKYGNSRSSGFTYGLYAGSILGPTEKSHQFAELSIAVIEKLNAVEHKAKTYHWYAMFSLTFHSWWGLKRESYMKAIKYGLETGDIRYLAYAIDHTTPFDPSFTIAEAIAFDREYAITLKATGYQEIILLRGIYDHYLLALCGKTFERLSMSDSTFDELAIVKKMEDLYFPLGPTIYHLLKSLLYFLYDDFAQSLEEIKKVQEGIMNAYYGCLEYMMYGIYKFLIHAALYDTLGKIEKKQALKIMKAELDKIKILSDHKRDNYIFHYFGMTAEIARIEGRPWGDVIDYYDQAIRFAEQYKFPNFVGLYSERAVKFLLQLNKKRVAGTYLQNASYAYEQWGASEKVKHLNEKYADLSTSQIDRKNKRESSEISTSMTISGEVSLDYNTILKLSKSLFEETNIQKLIEKTLKILAENIGAQYCALLLIKNEKLLIEGIFDTLTNKLEVLSSIEVSDEYVPVKLVNYVLHSNQDVVIDHIFENAEYSNAHYYDLHPAKSVICVPIIYHKSLVGVFYGEHREIIGAFTDERLEMLRVLSGQIAISIENARLYTSFERFVPREFLNLLSKKSIIDIDIGDSIEMNITALFSDIRNYTTYTEKQSSEEAFRFINTYLKEMTPIIRDNHGFINQFRGDGIIALFPRSGHDGVNAAIAMNKKLREFNIEETKHKRPKIEVGYGLNTGPASLGVIGEENRMDANVISDAINLASRLESLNKDYGTRLLISSNTFESLTNPDLYIYRVVDKVRVKGKLNTTTLYEIYLEDEGKEQNRAYFKEFDKAFSEYLKGNFENALHEFNGCLKMMPTDTVAKVLKDRCSKFVNEGIPKDWDGVFTLLSK